MYLFYALFFTCLCFTLHLKGDVHPDYEEMNRMALEANTDKSSEFHDYMTVYAPLFATYKDKPINFLEIGIYKGDSVKLWEKYFTNASLHFIDITDANIQYYSDRAHYHFLDQTNAIALNQFGNSFGAFDIIIDDGGHTMEQQITSFKTLFDHVKPGGLYIIEDIQTSYWKSYGGGGTQIFPLAGENTTVGFLKKLVDDLNMVPAKFKFANIDRLGVKELALLTPLQQQIKAVHFYPCICVIEKR